ncbi:hypothetical protein PR202_ga17727 [Eleusine coracana subsp. coracana]|uniref:Uncharacterized protein n=1 Tax=Eleusine coracana subsp. coracana TaxID=191504 RepID=A0AAV5CRN8_ELECO|nr:hypothetical protein PR202_ga17480 [Eleusine coracana subsp. coracana]GJN00537.1 hypothetical protein PR202_ga17727 [Eleusine coracana subsp. coracana]
MWVFYMISLPLTVGMVAATLRYFAGPAVPHHVLAVVGYAWLCSLSFVVLVPTDIWTVRSRRLSLSPLPLRCCLPSSVLCAAIAIRERSFGRTPAEIELLDESALFSPLYAGNVDAKAISGNQKSDVGFFWSWSYWSTFTLAWSIVPTLQGYEDSGDFTFKERLKTSIHKNMTYYATVGSIGLFGLTLLIIMRHDWYDLNLHHQSIIFHLSKVVQATSSQMSKRDPLRPCMDTIDNMLAQMVWMHSYHFNEYMTYVMEALELEDTIRNLEQRDPNGWKYISSFRKIRSGRLGSFLDSIASILLAEATLLPSGVDLSLFSNLINVLGKREILVQILLHLYLFLTSIIHCRMVARYAPPISYNFLNLIHLGDSAKTTFEKRMGTIDDIVPFFGRDFNRIYPLIMVVYTLLVAGNFFEHLINFFGSLKRFKYWTDQEDDIDGFDPYGVIILQRERTRMEHGSKTAYRFLLQAEETVSVKTEQSSIRQQSSSQISMEQVQKGSSSTPISIEAGDPENPSSVIVVPDPSVGVTSSTWTAMKTSLLNFKSNLGSKKFLRLSQSTNASATESLDEIFQRLKRHSSSVDHLDDDVLP